MKPCKTQVYFFVRLSQPFQHIELFFGEEAPFSTRQVFFCETGEKDTVQFNHLVSEMFKNPADDTVFA